MEPRLGWSLLSRDAVRRAELHLRDDGAEGVRDEVGFLSLHQAYADRFFPGTSVLHTRLRYALFVPWLYEEVSPQAGQGEISEMIERREIGLAGRLKAAGETGVIGGRRYPRQASQPPTTVYWPALGSWRILRALADGTYPSRQSLHRSLARRPRRGHVHDDDGQPLAEEQATFVALPRPPREWRDATLRLDFDLTAEEQRFLRGCFLSVPRPGHQPGPSLLARLVGERVPLSDRTELWSAKIRNVADPVDRDALVRARQVAAIAAIGRGVYAALVEEVREREDALATETKHRDHLGVVVSEFARDALSLNVYALTLECGSMSASLSNVLQATQQWLRTKGRLSEVRPVFAVAESKRKGRRARLADTLMAREQRAEWQPGDTALAAPLHFRWNVVRRLLLDLAGSK